MKLLVFLKTLVLCGLLAVPAETFSQGLMQHKKDLSTQSAGVNFCKPIYKDFQRLITGDDISPENFTIEMQNEQGSQAKVAMDSFSGHITYSNANGYTIVGGILLTNSKLKNRTLEIFAVVPSNESILLLMKEENGSMAYAVTEVNGQLMVEDITNEARTRTLQDIVLKGISAAQSAQTQSIPQQAQSMPQQIQAMPQQTQVIPQQTQTVPQTQVAQPQSSPSLSSQPQDSSAVSSDNLSDTMEVALEDSLVLEEETKTDATSTSDKDMELLQRASEIVIENYLRNMEAEEAAEATASKSSLGYFLMYCLGVFSGVVGMIVYSAIRANRFDFFGWFRKKEK